MSASQVVVGKWPLYRCLLESTSTAEAGGWSAYGMARECYAGEQSHPPLVAVKEEEPDVRHQNMDWNTNELERMTSIIGDDTPWSRLFEMTFAPQYRLITVEFLSTFVFRPRAADQPQADPDQPEVSFRLCGLAYAMSLAEFGNALGLYTEEELEMPIYTSAIHTADDAVVSAWWPQIGDEPFVQAARVTHIRDPLIRYLHRSLPHLLQDVA
ncbi:hypothetical protein R6Q57_009022 [Mikania cordata]